MWFNKKIITVFLICFPIFLLYSCEYSSRQEVLPEFFGENSYIHVFNETSEPKATASFYKSIVIHESDEAFFNNNPKIAADSDGRVYIEGNKKVHVFDQNGTFIGTIGREGRGPGEFQVIHNFKISGDDLYVYDANLSRVSVFETESTKLQEVINIPSVNGSIGLGEFDLLGEEHLIVGMRQDHRTSGSAVIERFMHYYMIDFHGNVQLPSVVTTDLSDYYEISGDRGVSYPPIPFDRTTLFSLSPSGKLYFLYTDGIAIKVLNSNGEFLTGIYHPFQNVEIQSDTEFPGFYHTMGIITNTKNILGDRLPRTHPAVSLFFVDDEERLWLSTIIDNLNLYDWWVLEKTGELITKFVWPRNEPIKLVKNGYMYTRQTDKETGLQQIVRYRIEFEEVKKHID